MDQKISAQDVLRCDLCETPVPPMYCDICHVKLCKACVGEHLSDLIYPKNIKLYHKNKKGTTFNYPKCPTHVGKQCELHCKECDLPVCSLCLSSNFHKGHNLLNLLEENKSKREAIEKDLDELLNSICPKYEEMSAEIQREKTGLEKHNENLTKAVTKQGEDWHREINIMVNIQKFEIDEMRTKHLATLNKQENEITRIISEVKQCILDVKRILDSNDVSLTSAYTPRNAEFSSLPSKVNVSLPSFCPHQINTEQLHQMFGSLSTLSIATDECGYIMKTPESENCPPLKELLDEPKLITTIDTWYKYLFSITCLSDEEIWTCGDDKIMKLYNLHGKLLKAIQTKSGNIPHDIAVTKSGDLVYTDPGTRTVNIVKHDQIQEVIRLQGWAPYNVCSNSSDDLLVIMVSDDKQSKIVRYSGSTEKQTIQFDKEGNPLYSSGYNKIKYISENKNLDICVADCSANAVIVVNQAGELRFRYTTTWTSFTPHGITTDSQGQILISDNNHHSIHILNQDGQLIRYIDHISFCDLRYQYSLCVDTKGNLFMAENTYPSGKVKKIKYM